MLRKNFGKKLGYINQRKKLLQFWLSCDSGEAIELLRKAFQKAYRYLKCNLGQESIAVLEIVYETNFSNVNQR